MSKMAYSSLYEVRRNGFGEDWIKRPISWSPEDAVISVAKIDWDKFSGMTKETRQQMFPHPYTVQSDVCSQREILVDRSLDGIWTTGSKETP